MNRTLLAALTALTLALTACGAEDDAHEAAPAPDAIPASAAPADAQSADPGAAPPAEDPPPAPPALPSVADTLACEARAWAPPALHGPGYRDGVLLDGDLDEVVVSSTVLFVHPTPQAHQRFGALVGPIILALSQADGLLGQATTFDEGCSVARTFTVWRDEASMYGFVGSEAHVAAMIAWAEFSRPESAVTHWRQPARSPLTWQDAVTRANAAEGVGVAP
ncbi:MAG: hypothetical protein H6702_11825 [Myxococcales bacterium]|nr:hypothetical protein [Myxococcales bacterium]